MKKTGTSILLILMFALIPSAGFSGDDAYEYGTHLYKTGNYEGAILELERFRYFNPNDSHNYYLQLIVALSYANTMQYNNALASLSGIVGHLENSTELYDHYDLFCESYFHMLNILFRQKRFYDFQIRKEQIDASCPGLNEVLDRYIISMSAAGHIYNMEWEKALEGLNKVVDVEGESSSMAVKNLLESEILSVMNHRDKSPVLGGILSIVPGFGHIYAGRFTDGVRSLLINSAFTALAVFSFYEDMPVLGGVFGVIEGFLYVSNIYGGVNAVMQENARYVIQKRDYMLKNISIPPLDVITVRKELNL